MISNDDSWCIEASPKSSLNLIPLLLKYINDSIARIWVVKKNPSTSGTFSKIIGGKTKRIH